MACLDTTLLLDLLGRGGRQRRARAVAKVEQLTSQEEELLTTRFNVAELYIGVQKARSRSAEEQRVAEVLRGLTILEFDDSAARRYGEITAYLHGLGRPVGDMDALIAATALAAGEKLVTRNPVHFEHIPVLVVEDY